MAVSLNGSGFVSEVRAGQVTSFETILSGSKETAVFDVNSGAQVASHSLFIEASSFTTLTLTPQAGGDFRLSEVRHEFGEKRDDRIRVRLIHGAGDSMSQVTVGPHDISDLGAGARSPPQGLELPANAPASMRFQYRGALHRVEVPALPGRSEVLLIATEQVGESTISMLAVLPSAVLGFLPSVVEAP